MWGAQAKPLFGAAAGGFAPAAKPLFGSNFGAPSSDPQQALFQSGMNTQFCVFSDLTPEQASQMKLSSGATVRLSSGMAVRFLCFIPFHHHFFVCCCCL
jgi:hypothetical protein